MNLVTSVSCFNPEEYVARMTDDRAVVVYDCDSSLGETMRSLKDRSPKLVFVLNARGDRTAPPCVKDAILWGRHWNMEVHVLNGAFAEVCLRENIDRFIMDGTCVSAHERGLTWARAQCPKGGSG